MSTRHYIMRAQRQKAQSPEEPDDNEPVVNRFSDIQSVDSRRHEVLDYLLMGYDEKEIAEYMDESPDTIRNDMKIIMKMGYSARDEDLKELSDEIMRTYRVAKKEAFRAFKLSQGKIEKVVVEKGTTSHGKEYGSEKVTTEFAAGDPRFLSVLIDSSKEMGKLSGAQKHKEVEIQQNQQQNIMNIASPKRSDMPSDFDRWTKKPEGSEVPDADGINSEDL